MMMAAASAAHAGVPQVILLGPRATRRRPRLLHRTFTECFLPRGGQPRRRAGGRTSRRLRRVCRGPASMKMLDGRPTAYLCRDGACEQPVNDPGAFRARLAALTVHRAPAGRP